MTDEEANDFSSELGRQFTSRIPGSGFPPFTGILEVASDYSYFMDKPIVGPILGKRSPEHQEKAYNTALSKYIGQWTGVATRSLPKPFQIGPAKLEHFLNSLTGGLYRRVPGRISDMVTGSTGWRWSDIPGLGAFAADRHPSASLSDFYVRWGDLNRDLEDLRAEDKEPTPEQRAEYDRVKVYYDAVSGLRKVIEDETNYDRRQNLAGKYQTGLAREALDLRPLDSYPSLWTARNLPTGARGVRDGVFKKKLMRVAASSPTKRKGEKSAHYRERRSDWDSKFAEARAFLKRSGASKSVLRQLLSEQAKKQGRKTVAYLSRFEARW